MLFEALLLTRAGFVGGLGGLEHEIIVKTVFISYLEDSRWEFERCGRTNISAGFSIKSGDVPFDEK